MRAAVQSALGEMEIREIEAPAAGPGGKEPLVRVRAPPLTCGTDRKILDRGHENLWPPLVMGHESLRGRRGRRCRRAVSGRRRRDGRHRGRARMVASARGSVEPLRLAEEGNGPGAFAELCGSPPVSRPRTRSESRTRCLTNRPRSWIPSRASRGGMSRLRDRARSTISSWWELGRSACRGLPPRGRKGAKRVSVIGKGRERLEVARGSG